MRSAGSPSQITAGMRTRGSGDASLAAHGPAKENPCLRGVHSVVSTTFTKYHVPGGGGLGDVSSKHAAVTGYVKEVKARVGVRRKEGGWCGGKYHNDLEIIFHDADLG